VSMSDELKERNILKIDFNREIRLSISIVTRVASSICRLRHRNDSFGWEKDAGRIVSTGARDPPAVDSSVPASTPRSNLQFQSAIPSG
jgi:hypothetical protein